MTNIKLEVGQVWIDSQGCTRKVLVMWGELDSHQVGYFFSTTNGTNCIGSMLCRDFAEDWTLITNAEGTPVEKPKKYKELTPVEAMRLLADCNPDDAIECELSDSGDWLASQLMGSSHGRFPFMDTDNNVWKRCRIEVSND